LIHIFYYTYGKSINIIYILFVIFYLLENIIMSGGIIQLVANGVENIYLTGNPQITFFKIVYRRHTNFSRETISLNFVQEKPNFGQTLSCNISAQGDLIDGMTLVIRLPKINSVIGENGLVDAFGTQTSKYNRFAWVRRIGYTILKKIDIEINGKVINCHYGEWMHIWNKLTEKSVGFDKCIGDIPELYDFTETKSEYLLYIPLYFWFCRNNGISLPMIALKYSNINVNVELNDFKNCHITTPTHYITCDDSLVNFKQYELIKQEVDNILRVGLFVGYDVINKRLYYQKLSQEKLIGIEYDSDETLLTPTEKNAIIISSSSQKYKIIGDDSSYSAIPQINTTSKTNYMTPINVSLEEVYLMVDYVFLDNDERHKMAKLKHNYLIEQLFFTPNVLITGTNAKIKLNIEQPCKLLVWVTQSDEILNANDTFNYTDSHKRYRTENINKKVLLGEPTGKNMIDKETILLNGNERMSFRSSNYFNYLQPYQHFKYDISEGINIYSFSLFPYAIQPSGSCNTSQFDTHINIKFKSGINIKHKIRFRSYALCQNILRIDGGIGALLFEN